MYMKNRAVEPLSRLTDPLIRRNGQLTTATWDEAFDHAARGLTATLESSGPNSIGLFSCSKSTNEMNYAAQKFMRSVIKSNNIDSCNRT
jgi:formate dehydrogenase major subunit